MNRRSLLLGIAGGTVLSQPSVQARTKLQGIGCTASEFNALYGKPVDFEDDLFIYDFDDFKVAHAFTTGGREQPIWMMYCYANRSVTYRKMTRFVESFLPTDSQFLGSEEIQMAVANTVSHYHSRTIEVLFLEYHQEPRGQIDIVYVPSGDSRSRYDWVEIRVPMAMM